MSDPDGYVARRDAYHLALGRFLDEFAETERGLLVAVATASSAHPDVWAVLFDTMTTANACVALIKYMAARDIPIPDNGKRAIDQLKLITTARNSLVHKGGRISADGGYSSVNSLFAPQTKRPIDVAPDVLDAMVLDLRVIQVAVMLIGVAGGGGGPGIGFVDNPALYEEVMANFRKVAGDPWHYTPA